MKKILSIILAAAMILSLVPSVFAEGGTATEAIVYDLTTGSFDMDNLYDFSPYAKYLDVVQVTGSNGSKLRTFYDPITYDPDATTNASKGRNDVDGVVGEIIYNFALASWDALSYIKKDANATYGAVSVPEGYSTMLSTVPKWAIESYDGLSDRRITSTQLRVTFKKTGESFVALRLKIEEEGDYDLTIASLNSTEDGGIANVHLLKAEAGKEYGYSDIVKNENFIGTYITDSNITGHSSFTARNVINETGEYILAFSNKSEGIEGGLITSVSSITLSPHDETAVETEVPFALPQKILHVGETLALEGVPYGAVLSSSAPDILTVNAKGEVIGKAMGKATITADVNGTKQSIEIPVVGENLISDPYFRTGLYNSGGKGTTNSNEGTDWLLTTSNVSGRTGVVTSEFSSDIILPGRTTAVPGVTVKSTDARVYIENATFTLDRNKIYEFTGWVKLEKNGELSLPEYDKTLASQIVTKYVNTSGKAAETSTSNNLWREGEYEVTDASVDWKMFTSNSVWQYRSNMHTGDEGAKLSVNPRFNLNTTKVADVAFAATVTEFSFHEVVPASIGLSADEITLGLGENDTKTATVSVVDSYSNTGTRITYYNSGAPKTIGTPSFESNNTAVATVEASTGVITAVGAGEATITVKTEIVGVTVSATVKVIVDGGEDKLPETVTAGVLTNYKDAASGVTASGYDVNSTKQVAVGTKITAEAKDTTDYKFICWKVGGAFLQTDAKVENYVVNTNTSLTAVYEPINTELKIVEFWNANKQFLSMDDDSEEGITIPIAPAVTGFTLTGNWLVDEGKYLDVDSLEVGTTRAVAEVNDTKNVITGDVEYDGAKVSEEHIYGTEVRRTVSGAKYWTRDSKTVFFGETYTYFMWDGTEIKAHTDEKELEPVIILDDYANGAYMIEYCVPEDFTKVESGILFGMAGSEPTVSEFSSKAASQSTDAHGQFTAQADDNEKVVRGYLIYQVDGEKKIIYTDVYTATAE